MLIGDYHRKIENPENVMVVEFDLVNWTHIYRGGFEKLEPANDDLEWHIDPECSERVFDPYRYLSLEEIRDQLCKDKSSVITIFNEGPFEGEIWQCGNYGDEWWCIGKTMGYA